tara:strand:- start:3396 stop:4976 length:1581 start_codon:yes stop_codon:yes gene_type:complete
MNSRSNNRQHRKRGDELLDLPIGVITEKRRGGPSVLSLLAKDLIATKVDSYIRSEIKNETSRIGYVVFREGTPLMAMHSGKENLHAANALEKIDDDAADLDCLLTVHRNVDVDLLLQTFPSSLLNLDLNLDDDKNSEWWKQKEISSKTWTSSKELPEQKFDTNNSPEFERAIEAKIRRMKGENLSELYPGHAYLISESNPNNALKLASKLSDIEHKLMIISRIPGSRINKEFDIQIKSCFWLTEKSQGEEQIIGPQLEILYSEIKDFFEKTPRSVVVLDGFEFLYAIHGRDRTLDFLRRLVDVSTTSDDLAFIPINLEAFDSRSRALIKRELDHLNSKDIEDWILSPEDLEGHLFHLPDKQEILWNEILNSKNNTVKNTKSQKEIPIIPEVIEIKKTQNNEINNEGSRLDLSGIIEQWDEEDSIKVDSPEHDIESEVLEFEDKSMVFEEHKGPKSPTKVKLLGTKQKIRKSRGSGKNTSLEQASKITKKKELRKGKNPVQIKKDKNKTYRQYYDASKHKGNSGGQD